MEPLLFILVFPGLFGGLVVALLIATHRQGTPSATIVPRRLAAPSPALINMANIPVEGATPGLGFLNAQRVWSSVEMQKDSDPDFHDMMSDPANSKMFRAASMFLPATPWDMPANYSLWARRLAESGLEDQDRVARGEEPKGFDIPGTAGEVMGYTFGPAASFDWLKDIFKISEAPALTQYTEGTEASGEVGGISASDLVVGPGGKTRSMDEVLREASGNLQNSLTQ